MAYQRRLAEDLDCPLLVADNSAHQMQREAAGLVAYAIRAVHDAARSKQPVHVDNHELAAVSGHIDA